MNHIRNRYRLIFSLLMLGWAAALQAQTPANTTIRNQAKSVYQYKSFPADTVTSVPVQFTVLAAPNFTMNLTVRDTNVFGKETVQVRLVYKNVGNLKADSAVVTAILPPAGTRIIPGSTGGTIVGNTVTWKVTDVESGESDSVGVKIVVDSTLVANTQLSLEGTIEWTSLQVSAGKTLVVGSFPRLEVAVVPSVPFIGSGRSAVFQIMVRNSGNIQANNVTLIDTLSALAKYVDSGDSPDSIRGGGKVLVWKIGNMAAFSQKTITLAIISPSNLATGIVRMGALAYAVNVASPAYTAASIPIVPVAPKSIVITSEPLYIFGKIGADSARITVELRDSLGQLLPDDVPVILTTRRGMFSTSQTTVATTIRSGIAAAILLPENVTNDIVTTYVSAVGGAIVSGTITDSIKVLIYPGAVTGVVVNGIDRLPFAGAIARVTNQSNAVIGLDTTKANGRFFIPLNKDVFSYLLEIYVIDKFGDTVSTRGTIDPTQFPKPPIVIPNTIAGRIQYRISGEPVPAEGITVILDSVSTAGAKGRNIRTKNLPSGVYSRVQEQKTDAQGRFKFENLVPARYVVSVDSTEFPTYKGYSFLSDTVSGTFTVNLNIDIEQDSSTVFTMQSPSDASAGDTVRYTIRYHNNGNLLQTGVDLLDTIPAFAQFVSAEKRPYHTFTYDSAGRIALWRTDSLEAQQSDSVHVTVRLSRNIPDSTKIRNSSWFRSNIHPALSATRTLTIRSAPVLNFGNQFVGRDSTVAGDSVYKRIWFSNTGTDSVKGITIIDSIYSAGKSKISLTKSEFDSVSVLDSVVTIFVGTIAPGESDSVTLRFYTDFSLPTGTTISSSAHLMRNDSSLFNTRTTLTMVENMNIGTFLSIMKTGNKKVAEIGDIVTYQIQVSNNSPTYLYSLGIYDLLPHAFKYVRNSARFNGKPAEPMMNPNINSLTWTMSDTMQSGKGGMLVYQLAVGADAMESEGMNTAYASAVASVGTTLLSAPSQWQVTVRPGVFTEKGLVIGKVFYDDNRNTYQESGENGVAGVELWMEDGTKIITGDDGKYSLPEVKPGQHVLRVNERTLPPGTTLLKGNNKFAGDAVSQFVRVTESGIAKANFFLSRHVADSVRQEVVKVNKLTGVRQSIPKFIYADTVHNRSVDTVEMFVSFVFSGAKYLQSIEVNEVLPSGMSIVPNSGRFNGRTVVPIIVRRNVQWRLGRAQDVSQGKLRYKVAITSMPRANAVLMAASTIRVMTADSVVIESQRLITENVVRDDGENRIETSDVISKAADPSIGRAMSDSAVVLEGDEVFFRISLFVDPMKKIRAVALLDSLEANFIINERSFTVNGIPLPAKNLSVRVRSSAFSSARLPIYKHEIDFTRIASVNLTNLIRKGFNEITYSARLISAVNDTMYRKTVHASVMNEFGEVSLTRSNENRIIVRASKRIPSVSLETTYVSVPRIATKIEEKVAVAVKLVETLKKTSARSVVMEGITFEQSKTVLTVEARTILDNIAALLIKNPDIAIQINGHTDNTGNASANRNISLERARSVRSYLIQRGIGPQRLVAQGFGSEKPIATNKTEEGRAKNRRVEFSRISR